MTGVERVGERRGGVERIREQRVEVGARRIEVPARRGDFVLCLCQRQAGLQRFEPRRGAGLESILRGIPHASLDGFEFLGDGHSPDRAHRLVVSAAHVGADVGGDPRGLRFRHRERGVRDVDAALPLAGQFEGNGPGEGPMGRLPRSFETDLGVRPLSCGLDAGGVNRARRPRGEQGPVGLDGAGHRIVQRQRGRRLRGDASGARDDHGQENHGRWAPRRRSGHPPDYSGAQMNGR